MPKSTPSLSSRASKSSSRRPEALSRARLLDLLANCELQHGHHLAAELLSRRAQAMREAGR